MTVPKRNDDDDGIPDAEYVAQLARHLASVPAARRASAKRGAVSIVIRLVPPPPDEQQQQQHFSEAPPPSFATPPPDSPSALQQALVQYLGDPRVAGLRAQVLFIQRAQYAGDPWSGHIGFPGGKQEMQDEGRSRRTAERETLEELGLGTGDGMVCLGRLDDVEAATALGRVIIVVSPWVFLQVAPQLQQPPLVLSGEVASAHWVDLRQLLQPTVALHTAASLGVCRGARPWVRWAAGALGLGVLQYPVVCLAYREAHTVRRVVGAPHGPFASDTELRLWGLSLVMAGCLVDWCRPPPSSARDNSDTTLPLPPPPLAAMWPRLHRVLWADFNLVVSAVFRATWRRPQWRSPRRPLAPGYFASFYNIARVAFPLACALRVYLAYALVRRVAGWLTG
ncbi:hypothetical protein LPJ53_004520 [Coemansia erecta]|uniref:Nudix hydrolase domain-containing protein n=1 Tax=Coemansia erecta TaxID=147472 RepID=A0A9W8CRJ5_9FUNG|nr:hypothetical protein LPJ53_004520 [Coemansia erecta]